MNYEIHPRDAGGYAIEMRSAARQWRATVTQNDCDLLVHVLGVAEGKLTHTVGYWWASIEAYPDDIAEDVMRLLTTLPRAA